MKTDAAQAKPEVEQTDDVRKRIRQMREARNALLGRLMILKQHVSCAMELLEEAERRRDEVQAACDAMGAALIAMEKTRASGEEP